MATHSSIFLENPMDRGTWQATVHRVTKSRARRSDWAHTHNFLPLPRLLLLFIFFLSPLLSSPHWHIHHYLHPLKRLHWKASFLQDSWFFYKVFSDHSNWKWSFPLQILFPLFPFLCSMQYILGRALSSQPLCLLLFSYSVMSDSLQAHGLQDARLPCPSPIPGAC